MLRGQKVRKVTLHLLVSTSSYVTHIANVITYVVRLMLTERKHLALCCARRSTSGGWRMERLWCTWPRQLATRSCCGSWRRREPTCTPRRRRAQAPFC